MCTVLSRTLSIAVALSFAAASPAQMPDCSLNKVPADALFYSTTMRLGEQWNIWYKSKAHAKLMSMPAMQLAMKHMHSELGKPNNPLSRLIAFAHAPENHELMELIHDLCRQEVFCYGGENNVKFLNILSEVGMGAYSNSIVQRFTGDTSTEAQMKAVLDGLKESKENLVTPDITIGFRTKKADTAKNMLPRLEAALNKAMEKAPKELQGRVKRDKIGEADALIIALDGSLLPWSKMNIEDLEDEKDEYKPVVDKIKAMKLTIAVTVKGDYVLLSFAGDTDGIKKFGAGTALATRPEFSPLSKFADKRLTSIGYGSKRLSELMGTTAKDLAETVDSIKEGLKHASLSDELQEKIVKDIDAFFKEMAASLPKPFATMGFTFLNGSGVEGYDYEFENASAIKALTVTDSLGGSPLMAAAGRGEDATPAYKNLVKWLKIFYGHAEAAATELAPENIVDQMKAGMEQILPYLKRFDEITGNQFLPALADGQGALVVDGKWTSKKWFPDVDQKGAELPLPEVTLVFGVSDSAKLIEAFKGYRKLVNDIIEAGRMFNSELPEGGIPEPKSQAVGEAKAFYWPLPQEGQDESIKPNIAVSKSLMTIGLSMKHAERLHSNKPLAGDWKKLANGNPIQELGWLDVAGLLNVARPWIENLAIPAMEREMKDELPGGMKKEDIAPQVQGLMDILSCWKSSSTVKYREGNNTIIHSVTVIEDIK